MRLLSQVLQELELSLLFFREKKLLLTKEGTMEQNCHPELCSPLLSLSQLKKHKFILGYSSAKVGAALTLHSAPTASEINGLALHSTQAEHACGSLKVHSFVWKRGLDFFFLDKHCVLLDCFLIFSHPGHLFQNCNCSWQPGVYVLLSCSLVLK